MNSKPNKHRTGLMDRMVFIGFGLAVIYWILEALMSTLQNEGTSFINHLVGYNLDEALTRLMVLCFFMILASHVQFTINQRKKLDEALIKSEEKYRTIIESIEDGYVEGSISLKKNSSGKVKGFKGLIRDVTRRRETEALKHAKAVAEVASKAKSEFLANMSHEIRTPLNAIIGLIELMRDSKLDAEQKEDLDIVLSAAYSLLSVINDILDFSKIEAGRLELEEIPISLRDMIGDSLKIIAKNAHKKGLELAYRVAPDIPDCVVGDPARLRQILLNLVGNAVKFTKKGEVIVSVEPVRRAETEVDLTFSVIDTGVGIARDKQERIFSPFEQADSGTSRRFGGTGLGLAVSAQLVKLMGGEICLESKIDKGSNFHFTVSFGIQTNKKDFSDIQYAFLREDYPDMIRVIKKEIKEGNADGLRRTAHALKGMLGNFQAESAMEMAYNFEKTGLNGDLGEAENRCSQLEDEVMEFGAWL